MLYKNLNPEKAIQYFIQTYVLDGISSFKFILNGKPLHVFYILKAHLKYYTLLSTFKKKRPQSYQAKLFPKSIVYLYFVKASKNLQSAQ